MSTDLTSYASVLTEAITLVTALVVAVAGLFAAVRFRRRAQVIAPVPVLIYVTSGSSPAPTAKLGVPRAVSCAPQGTVTKIPQWISSTRTPIMIIMVLLFAISSVLVNRVQVWDEPSSNSSATATRLLTGINDYSASIGPDDVSVITVNGQVWDVSGITHGEKVVVFVHGVTLNNDRGGTIGLQSKDVWVKVGEATLDVRGSWTADFQVPAIVARDTSTTPGSGGNISIAAIVVSPEAARLIKPTMTLADLDVYGRSPLVQLAIQQELPGRTGIGASTKTSPATPATGIPWR